MFLVIAACLLVVAMALPFNAVENPHFYNGDVARKPYFAIQVQPVSYKRYFRCNNCFLFLLCTINLSLSTDLDDPPLMETFYMKHAVLHRVF